MLREFMCKGLINQKTILTNGEQLYHANQLQMAMGMSSYLLCILCVASGTVNGLFVNYDGIFHRY